jgi:two-component system phosphate regulon sensor histidine kinase PhoR
LHSRLILLNGCAIGIVTLLLGYFLSSGIRGTLESEIEDELHNSANLAKAYVGLHAGRGNPIQLANDISKSLDVRVTIIAPDGVVLGDSDLTAEGIRTVENHSDRPEVIDALRTGRGTSIRWSATVGMPFIYVATIADGWVLRLAKPLSTVDILISRLRRQLFLAMVVSLGMTFMFGSMVYAVVTRPLRRMAEASQQFAVGNLDHHIPVMGDTDLAHVGASLNAMARSLRTRMEDLVEGKRQVEAIVDAMSAGVVVFDREARAVIANEAIRQMLELPGDPAGRTPMEVVRHSAVLTVVRQALEGIKAPTVELTTAGGKVLSARATPVHQLSGQVESAVVVFHDLTELRRLERMRKDFVANISHELKTPLTSIRGYAETLLSQPPETSAITTEFLQAIERNAELLQNLVDDLLVLARLESEPPIEKQPTQIHELIEREVRSRARSLEEKGIAVQVECPAAEVLVDQGRLSKALSNLLDNAIHYNRAHGQIRVTGRETPAGFAIEVADTGSGIPQRDLSRVFERFYRVEKSRARNSGGAGLGLAIAKHAVESQGGSISVSSKLGAGSTFTIMLPKE